MVNVHAIKAVFSSRPCNAKYRPSLQPPRVRVLIFGAASMIIITAFSGHVFTGDTVQQKKRLAATEKQSITIWYSKVLSAAGILFRFHIEHRISNSKQHQPIVASANTSGLRHAWQASHFSRPKIARLNKS